MSLFWRRSLQVRFPALSLHHLGSLLLPPGPDVHIFWQAELMPKPDCRWPGVTVISAIAIAAATVARSAGLALLFVKHAPLCPAPAGHGLLNALSAWSHKSCAQIAGLESSPDLFAPFGKELPWFWLDWQDMHPLEQPCQVDHVPVAICAHAGTHQAALQLRVPCRQCAKAGPPCGASPALIRPPWP